MPWYQAKIADSLDSRGFSQVRSVPELLGFVNQAVFPLYVKPVDGSQRSHIHLCEDLDDIVAIVSQYEEDRIRVMLVEEAVTWPDFRLVFLQGELISAYERIPLAVVGNGVSNVDQLLLQMQVEFRSLGRDTKIDVSDPRIDVRLNRLGLARAYIPTDGMELCLLDISNLSAGGLARDVTGDVASGWIRLGQSIAREMSLAFCGIDLACANIARCDDEYAILEVNAAPGLDHYAASGVTQESIGDFKRSAQRRRHRSGPLHCPTRVAGGAWC
jgi:D-alanine-D-alanine ligase-like ATP-grasp enzyme